MPFICLKKEITIGKTTYPPGQVVEVDKVRRKVLVDRGHAEDHPGPAGPPSPAETAAGRVARPETAIARTAPERTVARGK